jgi:hypothetical protein
MSRVQFEKDLAEFLDGVLKDAEAKIAERYPGAFEGFPDVDSPVGVSRPRHELKRQQYHDALAAGVRWSIWIREA